MRYGLLVVACVLFLLGCEGERRHRVGLTIRIAGGAKPAVYVTDPLGLDNPDSIVYNELLTEDKMAEIAPLSLWEGPVLGMPYQNRKYVFGKDRKEAWDNHSHHWFLYRGGWQTDLCGCSCKANHPGWAGDFDGDGHCVSCRGDSRPGACNCRSCQCRRCGWTPSLADHPNAERNERLRKEYAAKLKGELDDEFER